MSRGNFQISGKRWQRLLNEGQDGPRQRAPGPRIRIPVYRSSDKGRNDPVDVATDSPPAGIASTTERRSQLVTTVASKERLANAQRAVAWRHSASSGGGETLTIGRDAGRTRERPR
jgi:hypothetical protein